MYVCLCNGVTSGTVQEAIESGARSTRDVAERCGAGDVCGRCRQTIRAMLAAQAGDQPRHKPMLRRWGKG
jgi:bacterioferritin-associated ferredoxin